MNPYILHFHEIHHKDLPLVGGKGANLGEMTGAGFPVPSGFCITTQAYCDFIAASTEMRDFFARLDRLPDNDLEGARILGGQIRQHLLQLPIPETMAWEIGKAWRIAGTEHAYAVRSSATAEDLPTASFAGQQDTYLNIKGEDDLLLHVKKCWASLFTDRAILYRAKNNFDHRQVLLSVVVQRMISPDMAGILFTADPINGNRNIVSIDASFGLGEALVSGLVSADLYKVKHGQIIEKNIARKKLAIYSLPEGGTIQQELPEAQQTEQTMPDELILQLAELGKKIEQHYGKPQDIEFCIEKEQLFVVQSRPITTLFPAAAIAGDDFRVLGSIGHIQVMLDPMKPLALSFFRTMIPEAVLKTAGGRLYVDLTDMLRSGFWRRILMMHAGNLDEQICRALEAVVERPEFKQCSGKRQSLLPLAKLLLPVAAEAGKSLLFGDPQTMHTVIEGRMKRSILSLRQKFDDLEGIESLIAVQEEAGRIIAPLAEVVYGFVTFIIASALLEKQLIRLTGSGEELHALAKSQSGNIMREMSLCLGDLADIVRQYPPLQDYLRHAEDRSFFQGLEGVEGGADFAAAFQSFLNQFGMRCPGEIDITRPRWREKPTMLVSSILSDVENLNQGEHRAEFARGLEGVQEAEQRILSKTNGLNRGYTKRLIDVYRSAAGLREHHKHMITLLFDEYKKPLMGEAERLVGKGILLEAEDVYWLDLEELIALSGGTFGGDTAALIKERKDEFERLKKLEVPRVMTSEGEIITGSAKKGDYPKGAFVGSPASAGVVEGVARVILSPEDAQLHEGEILIAPHTDPGWTPLFQVAGAVVTEVGGLMTHGSVVAREYGIPAVVGVEHATSLILDGQKIRVNGSRGYVEVLDSEG